MKDGLLLVSLLMVAGHIDRLAINTHQSLDVQL